MFGGCWPQHPNCPVRSVNICPEHTQCGTAPHMTTVSPHVVAVPWGSDGSLVWTTRSGLGGGGGAGTCLNFHSDGGGGGPLPPGPLPPSPPPLDPLPPSPLSSSAAENLGFWELFLVTGKKFLGAFGARHTLFTYCFMCTLRSLSCRLP